MADYGDVDPRMTNYVCVISLLQVLSYYVVERHCCDLIHHDDALIGEDMSQYESCMYLLYVNSFLSNHNNIVIHTID